MNKYKNKNNSAIQNQTPKMDIFGARIQSQIYFALNYKLDHGQLLPLVSKLFAQSLFLFAKCKKLKQVSQSSSVISYGFGHGDPLLDPIADILFTVFITVQTMEALGNDLRRR